MLNNKTILVTGGKKIEYGFSYTSGNNKEWYFVEDLRRLLQEQYYSKKKNN